MVEGRSGKGLDLFDESGAAVGAKDQVSSSNPDPNYAVARVLEEWWIVLAAVKDVVEEEEEEAAVVAVVEEETENWLLDAEVGWGIRASDYFEKHAIKNVVDENEVEIDWEGEIDDNSVKEINCLEWEIFAFHPSPLIVFVFERYNRAGENWKGLKELEKAVKVFWDAKDRPPPG